MGLVEYLQDNSGEIRGATSHKMLVRNILTYLDRILYPVPVPSEVYTEVRLFQEGKVIGQVDIVAIDGADLTVIEAKSSNGSRRQLITAYRFFWEEYRLAARMIAVHGMPGSNMRFYELPRKTEYLIRK